jgi:copper transport protein
MNMRLVTAAEDRRSVPSLWTDRLRRTAAAVVAVLVVVGTLLAAPPAAAHSRLSGSDPVEESTVPSPIDVVRLRFSSDVRPVPERFVVTATDGAVVAPQSIDNEAPSVIAVRFPAALPAGAVTVAWATRAADSHVMTGRLSFTVDGPVPTAPPSTAAVTPPPSVAPVDPAGGTPSDGFGDALAAWAQWLLYGALLLVVGGCGYLAWIHRGSVAETRSLVRMVRVAAGVVVAASLLDWTAHLVMFGGVTTPSAWDELSTSWFALATLLRLGAAVAVFAVVRPGPVVDGPAGRPDGSDTSVSQRTSSGGVVLDERIVVTERAAVTPRWLIGPALLVASESFTGHTATTSPWPVVVAADAAHLVAAALWAGCVGVLAFTLRQRRRRGEPLDARPLALRFSVTATRALVAVTVSGLLLAGTILDGVGGLVSTEFGRLLILKVVAVAVVAGVGAYNHRVLVPALERHDEGVDDRFLRSLLVEAGIFVAVTGVTALLVAASPV